MIHREPLATRSANQFCLVVSTAKIVRKIDRQAECHWYFHVSSKVKRIGRGFHPPRRSITPYRAPYAADPRLLSGCHSLRASRPLFATVSSRPWRRCKPSVSSLHFLMASEQSIGQGWLPAVLCNGSRNRFLRLPSVTRHAADPGPSVAVAWAMPPLHAETLSTMPLSRQHNSTGFSECIAPNREIPTKTKGKIILDFLIVLHNSY